MNYHGVYTRKQLMDLRAENEAAEQGMGTSLVERERLLRVGEQRSTTYSGRHERCRLRSPSAGRRRKKKCTCSASRVLKRRSVLISSTLAHYRALHAREEERMRELNRSTERYYNEKPLRKQLLSQQEELEGLHETRTLTLLMRPSR